MKTIKIRGNDYATVAARVSAYRLTYPISDGWGIVTHCVHVDADVVRFRAEIRNPAGLVVATGHAEELRASSRINAVAARRALTAAGFATDGTGYASADELVNKLNQRSGAYEDVQTLAQKRTSAAQRMFIQALNDRSLAYEDVQKLARSKNWGNPDGWSAGYRKRFIEALDAGDIVELEQ